jgi:hypothetical protein
MRAFQLRASLTDLTSSSEVIIVTTDGEILEIVSEYKKHSEAGQHRDIVLTVRSTKPALPPQKKAGVITEGSGW